MPYMGSSTPSLVSNRLGAAPTMQDQQVASQSVVQQDRGLLATIAGDTLFGVADLADTVASSIPFASGALGIERGDLNERILQTLDMPGLRDFYNDNRQGIEVASGIEGIIGAELITRRLTAPTSAFMAGVSKVPYLRRIATMDAEYANAMQTVRNVDLSLARSGALGQAQYAGRAVVDSTILERGAFVNTTVDTTRRAAFWGANAKAVTKGATRAGITEGIMAIGLNQNGFLYDDDMGQNLAWMALGVGLGGAAEWAHGVYNMRKYVNSDEVRRAFAGALDPENIEEGRLLWHGKKVSDDLRAPAYFGGAVTDRITNLLTEASFRKESREFGKLSDLEARALLSNREALATQNLKEAFENLGQVTSKGIITDGLTRFGPKHEQHWNHLQMAGMRDPGAFYGAEMLGAVGDEVSVESLHKTFLARNQERIEETERLIADEATKPGDREQLQSLRRKLQATQNLTPKVLVDGEWHAMSEAESVLGYAEPKIDFTPADSNRGVKGLVKSVLKSEDKKGLWSTVAESSTGKVAVDSDFIWSLPGKQTLDGADHFRMLDLYRVGNMAVKQMAEFKGVLTLPKKADWFQLDMAEEVLRLNPNAQIAWPAGLNRETAQIESFKQKARALKKWDAKEQLKMIQLNDKGLSYEGSLSKLRTRYNLPKMTGYERGLLDDLDTPVERLMRGINDHSDEALKEWNLSDYKQAIADFKRLGDIAPVTANDVESLSGKSFNFMMDESGRPVKPVIGYFRPFQQAEWTKEHLAERLAARKLETMATLMDPKAAPMSRSITQQLMASPAFQKAAATHELADIQIQGLMGSSPMSFSGSVRNAIATSDHIARDSDILKAASQVRETANRIARDSMKAAMEGAFKEVLGKLENPRNAASKMLIDQFHSLSSGWDIARKTTRNADGFHTFTLLKTPANAERFKAMFGRDMAESQVLLAPDGRQLVLDDLGLEAQLAFNKASEVIRAEKNTLLRANGRGEIAEKPWFTPPANTKGKFIGFVIGPDGKSVPNMGVVANTEAEFLRQRQIVESKLESKGLGYQFRTQDEIRDFANLWDRVEMDFIDPGTTAVQSGKKSRGALSGPETKVNAFHESRLYLQDQMLKHSNDLVETLFKEQLSSSQMRAQLASAEIKTGPLKGHKNRTVYDIYRENLLGYSKLNSQGSWVGKIYNGVEGAIDGFLRESTPGAAKTWAALNGWLDARNPWSRSAEARKDFESLAKALGQYMPFESATRLLEARGAGATPPTIAKIGNNISYFTSTMMLRVAEFGQPIMNLAGIINAMPSIVRHLQGAGEDSLRMYGDSFQLGDKKITTLNLGKVAARAFKNAWSKTRHADFDYMVKRGYLSQEVAEFHRQFGAIESKGKWEGFFLGDPTKKGFSEKGVVGWTSLLSDKSEDFSRSWGHMIGLELADMMGMKGIHVRNDFAHEIANKMIANYSPANRPEIFQGAFGGQLGLFQSFIQNYYERLFRYVETKDYHAFATQYATQAGMFGTTGLAGWNQFNSLINWTSEGEENPTTGFQGAFGSSAGDLLAHGVLSNLPKIFGAPGVDLFGRGDTNVRVPGVGDSSLPGVSAIQRFYNGFQEGLALFASQNPELSGTRLAEVASNAIANRPIAGMLEVFFADGNDTDRYGQLVSQANGAMETAYRLMGLRSERQSNEIAAFYANKNAQESQNSAKELLRAATRAAFRDGTFESKADDIFTRYLETGGDPRYFRRWVKSNYTAATSSRAERQLDSVMKDPAKLEQALRLMEAGVGIAAEESVGDPYSDLGAMNDLSTMAPEEMGNIGNQMEVQIP